MPQQETQAMTMVIVKTLKVVKTLKELSTIHILMSAVKPDDDDCSSNDSVDPLPYGQVSRCACDFYQEEYLTNHTTEEFISLLPLPETVKELMNEVALKLCEEHPPLEPALALGDSDDDSGLD